MHPSVAAHREDGFALRPDLRLPASKKMGWPRGAGPGFPWLRLSVGCIAALAVLAYSAQQQDAPAFHRPSVPVHRAVAGAPSPVWTPVPRPLPIFGLDAPQVTSLPFAFTARRNAAGAREDTLVFGAFDHDAAPHLRIILHRSLHPDGSEPSLFLDLARRASAAAGLAVVRSTPAEGLATKFGVMDTSEVTLSDNSERVCLAFRFDHEAIGFRIAGWACLAQGQVMDLQELACTLDRLSLVEPGNDEALKSLFAQADGRRIAGCTPAPAISSLEPRTRQSRRTTRPPPRQAGARAQVPATAAQRGSATLPRATARGAGNASPGNRG